MPLYPENLPEGLTAYRRTDIFTEQTLPAGLRRDHSTKAGVWALIHVVEGRLRYCVADWDYDEVLVAGTPGIVAPQVKHFVEPLGEVRMFVEFYAAEQPASQQPHEEEGMLP